MSASRNATEPGLGARWAKLETRLAAVSHLLRRQGSITSKRAGKRKIARLRFFEPSAAGRRVQRSVYIGCDPELIRRARLLLAVYRGEPIREAAALAQFVGVFRRLIPTPMSRIAAGT